LVQKRTETWFDFRTTSLVPTSGQRPIGLSDGQRRVISSRPCTRLQAYVKAVGNSGLATRADRCSIEADTEEPQVTLREVEARRFVCTRRVSGRWCGQEPLSFLRG